jgi:hypothetical protein
MALGKRLAATGRQMQDASSLPFCSRLMLHPCLALGLAQRCPGLTKQQIIPSSQHPAQACSVSLPHHQPARPLSTCTRLASTGR